MVTITLLHMIVMLGSATSVLYFPIFYPYFQISSIFFFFAPVSRIKEIKQMVKIINIHHHL